MEEYDCINCRAETGKKWRNLAKIRGIPLVDLMETGLENLLKEGGKKERQLLEALEESQAANRKS